MPASRREFLYGLGAMGAFAFDPFEGSIAAGKLADLVVLGQDVFKEDPGNIINMPIARTMVGGQWVWES